jgi:hypothetical protein
VRDSGRGAVGEHIEVDEEEEWLEKRKEEGSKR